jgi:hypothetical protein
MTYDDLLRLRDLDAADPVLSAQQHDRATATLQRIMATDPDAPGAGSAASVRPRRGPRRLLLTGAAVAVVAVVTAVALVLPTLSNGSQAFASWSPVPTPLAGADRAAAVHACLVLQGEGGGGLRYAADARPSVLVAEARGGWSYVVFTVDGLSQPLQGSCLLPDDVVADPRPGEGGFFGSLGPTADLTGPFLAADGVRQDSYGVGAIDREAFVYVEGRSGPDVRRIEVTTPGGRHVRASLARGHWAAWWPAGDDAMDNPELTGAPTYVVTLRDGTRTSAVTP